MLKQEYTNCNLCGKDDNTLCFEVEEKISGAREKFRVVKCRNCGSVYVNPRPSKTIMSRYYPKEDYYAYQPYETKQKSFKQRIKEIVMEHIGNYPNKNEEKFWVRWMGKFIAQTWKNSVSVAVPYKKGGRVLDLGCGAGRLLDWLKRHGWQTYGVEISKQAAEYGKKRGLNIFNGELVETKFPQEFFDAVVINQVLEHLYDPKGILWEVYRVLRPGGLLIVGVPNIESYESKVFGEYWSPLDIPRHLYHFSYETLKTMLQKTGFIVEKMVGKTFLIPHSNRESLNSLKKESKLKLLLCFFKVYLWKYIRYIFSDRKDLFGEFTTFYATKR